jgi:phosphatidylglycerophosphate synthase
MAFFEKRLPLPDVNPSFYSTLGIALSVLFLYAETPLPKALIIGLALLADWIDGATARRYGGSSKDGYLADAMADRASEALIFAAEAGTVVGQAFFVLWMINVALTFYSIRINKHWLLPLRFSYLLILIAQGT